MVFSSSAFGNAPSPEVDALSVFEGFLEGLSSESFEAIECSPG